MSHITDKFGLSQESYKLMLDKKIIGCHVKKYDELISFYKDVMKKNGGQKMAAISETADRFKITERWTFNIIKEYE